MNHLARQFFAVTVGLLLAAAVASGAPASARAKSADQFARTKAHIEALLKHRLNPEPLPANLPNPFQAPGGTAVVDAPRSGPPGNDPPPPVNSDSETLVRLAAALKITGRVKLNDQVHLIINQATYKEGDRIPIYGKSDVTYLQVIRIAPGELTLGLNEAMETVRFNH